MRYRILLPILMLMVSLAMHKTGSLQRYRMVQSIVAKYGHLEHPLPEHYAVASYVDYGLNAPAWLLSLETPFLAPASADLSCCGFIDGEKDWQYFIFLILLWFLIGLLLDRNGFSNNTGLTIVTRGACGLYGTFLCYWAIRYYYFPPWVYPRFVVVPIAAWGVALLFGSLYPFSVLRKKAWYYAVSMLITVSAGFYFEAGVRIYRFRASFGTSTVIFLFVCGAILMLVSIYLFIMSRRRVIQSM